MKVALKSKSYRTMVNDYFDITTRAYREVWGADFFHLHFWKKGQTKHEGLQDTHEYIFKKLHTDASAVVADFGCGVGAFSFVLAQHFAHVTAVNFNKKQLSIAKKTAKKLGTSNVTFVESDIMETAFTEAFDIIFLYDVDVHLPDKQKVLKILHKALKPGGKLVIAAWLIPSKVSEAAKLTLIDPFVDIWPFPAFETDRNYQKYFRKKKFEVLVREDWTDRIGRSITRLYDDALGRAENYTYKDLAKTLDISLIKHVLKFKKRAVEIYQGTLYFKALYDANLFLYYLYIVQKEKS